MGIVTRVLAPLLSGMFAACLIGGSFAQSGFLRSGVAVGGTVSAFHAWHASGPDRNTNTCPVCNYPYNPAVQVWVNTDTEANVTRIADYLENAIRANPQKRLKAFLVFLSPGGQAASALAQRLQSIARDQHLERVSLVMVNARNDRAISDYQINISPAVKNTVFVYRYRRISRKFVNFTADDSSLQTLNSAIQAVIRNCGSVNCVCWRKSGN